MMNKFAGDIKNHTITVLNILTDKNYVLTNSADPDNSVDNAVCIFSKNLLINVVGAH